LAIVVLLACANLLAQAPPEPKYKFIPQTPPATEVNSVSISPDGSLVATAAGEGGVRLYDAKNGKLLRTLGDVGDRCVVFSPDGQTLTAAGFHMDKLVSLWDVKTGKRLRSFAGHTEWECDATAISPDGTLLASTGVDKQILVWDIASGNLKLQLKNQPARMAALAFSPDSSTLAAGGGDKIVYLFDCATGKIRQSLSGQSDWICTLAFTPDGKRLAAGSCDWGFHRGHNWPRPFYRGVEQCQWILWEVASGKAVRDVHDRGRMLSLAFAPDGKFLACGIGREARLYSLQTDSAPKLIATHDGDVTSVAFTPDGSSILSASHDQTVQCTQVAGATMQWRAPGSFDVVNCISLSPDASLLATASSDWRVARATLPPGAANTGPGAIRIWDLRTGRMIRRLGDPSNQFLAVAISPGGKHIAAGAATRDNKGAVHVWDAQTGTETWSTNDDRSEILSVAFSPDGSSLAAGAADGSVKLRDGRTGAVIHTLPNHTGGASSLIFSPDSTTLYAARANGGALVWNARTGKLLHTIDSPASSAEFFTVDRRLSTLTLTADGRTLAVCASSINNEYTSPLQLFDTSTYKLTRDFSSEKIHGRPALISPDGNLLATGGKGVQLYDAHTAKPLRQLFSWHLKRTQSVVFSADSKFVVEGGSYGTVNLWQTSTGRLLATLFAFNDPQTGVPSDAFVAATPEGPYTASSNIDSLPAWRVGTDFLTSASLPDLNRPDQVTAALGLPYLQAR
jgi:WD40 repeat protein